MRCRLKTRPAPLVAAMVLLLAASARGATTVEVRINDNLDDAEENNGDGSINNSSTDLELISDGGTNQTVGMRFTSVAIPAGVTIETAYIQFQCDETDSGATNLTIRGEDADDAAAISTSSYDISSRTTTSASVAWAPPAWNTIGQAGAGERTSDIATIIQEIVDRAGWASGNDIVIIVTGSGERTAESHNGDSGAAPLLHVEFSGASGGSPGVGTDDCEEWSSTGNIYINSTDVELAVDGTTSDTVGIRFPSIDIPAGDAIRSAYIQFKTDETGSGACSLTIRGEDIDDAPTFTTANSDITNRTTTTASVAWSPAAWNTVGEAGAAQRTPDLSSIVQEIVERPGWASGNDIVMIITGTGKRTAESYEGDASGAPHLVVTHGPLLLTDHDSGQEADAFSESGGETNAELFAFKLDSVGATVTVTQLVFRLSSITGLVSGDWTGVEIIEDANGDGAIGGGETTAVGGAGVVNQPAGTITFSSSFTVTTGANYILRADFASLSQNDEVTIGLAAADVTSVTTVTGSTTSSIHSEKAVIADLLLVVVDAGSLDAEEAEKRSLFEDWKYRVTPISATDSQASFDAAAAMADVIYISETVLSTDLGTKLKATTRGVVNDEQALTDEFGISSSSGSYTDDEVDITDNAHYITESFATGVLAVCDSDQPLHVATGTLGGGAVVLGEQPSSANAALLAMEIGGALDGGGTAMGRRVHLPWGSSGFDIGSLTPSGQNLLKRSLKWAWGPIAWWKLDDGAGATAVDSRGSHDGTLTGGVWTTGHLGGGLDESSDYVTVANTASLQITDEITITAWIKGNSWSSGSLVNLVCRKGDDNPNNYQLAIADGKVALMLDDGDSGGFRGDTSLSTGQWHHVAATWDGSNVRVYLDGVQDHASPFSKSGAIAIDTRNLYLGGRPNTDYFDGIIDDVRLFNRGLSEEEVVATMAGEGVRVVSWTEIDPN